MVSFNYSKALDSSKDQSYFLHRLNQAQLRNTLFPLGEINKTEVRKIAEQINLPNAKKKIQPASALLVNVRSREF